MEDSEWILKEEELIRNAIEKGKVILGSCFGQQMIARAAFGKKSLKKRTFPEVGWIEINVGLPHHPFLIYY